MAHYQNLPVFKDAYDLLLRVYTVSRTFQRDFRYTIGEDLKKVLMEMMLCLFRANRSRAKLGEVACERAEAISKQLAAWDKYLTKNAVVRRDGGESNDL